MDDMLLRLHTDWFVDYACQKWVVLMTDPVSGNTYHFKYDCCLVQSAAAAVHRAVKDLNEMWSPQ